jgi:hypothetical protein
MRFFECKRGFLVINDFSFQLLFKMTRLQLFQPDSIDYKLMAGEYLNLIFMQSMFRKRLADNVHRLPAIGHCESLRELGPFFCSQGQGSAPISTGGLHSFDSREEIFHRFAVRRRVVHARDQDV